LSVDEATQLRRQMRAAGARYRVTKNRLARRAIEGTPFAALAPLFTGPTAIAFSRDPVAAARAAVEYANRNNKLTVIGGGLSGQPLDAAGIRALATLPSLDELRSKIIGLLNAPATKLAVLLQTPAGQLARVVAAHSEQGGAGQANSEPANSEPASSEPASSEPASSEPAGPAETDPEPAAAGDGA
jgi:large subunit ribosomal protein L10